MFVEKTILFYYYYDLGVTWRLTPSKRFEENHTCVCNSDDYLMKRQLAVLSPGRPVAPRRRGAPEAVLPRHVAPEIRTIV